MTQYIPLIGSITDAEAKCWSDQLNHLMPEQAVVPLKQLTTQQRERCDVAIVANPSIEEIEQCPNLKWVQSLWAGVERLVTELNKSDFKIVRLIDPTLADTMAEAVLAWSLFLHRDMPYYRRQQDRKKWSPKPYTPVSERTIGLLGMGALGRASGERLLNNGFKVLGWSRTAKKVSGITTYHDEQGLVSLLSQSDIVVCLLPLTTQTYHLLGAELFSKFKQGASLINFARGAIIDQGALLKALTTRQLDHAVLDVFEQEPLDALNPIWSLPNVTILPHISAPTRPDTASHIVATNILNYRQTGVIPAAVDVKKGY